MGHPSTEQAWVDFESVFERVGEDPGRAAMDRLGLRVGDRVLDIGCGTGRTTLELAGRARTGGTAVGIDISEELVWAARARAAAVAAEDVSFVHADAARHRFTPGSFDAAYSRFGVMFFDDPVAAFGNLRVALRPGAALSFVSWQPVLANDWIVVPVIAAASVTGHLPAPPDSDGPGPFSLADADKVRALLEVSGFSDVDATPLSDDVILPSDLLRRFAEMVMSLSPLREPHLGAQRDEVLDAVVGALLERAHEGVVRLRRSVLLVRATAA